MDERVAFLDERVSESLLKMVSFLLHHVAIIRNAAGRCISSKTKNLFLFGVKSTAA